MIGQDFNLLALQIGGISQLGIEGVLSGIDKTPVDRAVNLSLCGFEGDRQGDTSKHGGPEKAVHHYPFDHYAVWRNELGGHSLLTKPGAFGENLTTIGLTEETIAIGDVFRLGTSIIEVSQGRQPCWRLNVRFGLATMAKQVQRTGRTGWYYRVLETGAVRPEDRLILTDRKQADWTLSRIWHAFYVNTLDYRELGGIANLPQLADGWRRYALRRLETGQVEDWSRRLGEVSDANMIDKSAAKSDFF